MKKIINKIKKEGVIKTSSLVLHKIIEKITYSFLNKTKLEKKIVFCSVPDISDNAKELYNYYKENNNYKEYKLVWLVDKPKKYVSRKDSRTIYVKKNSKNKTVRTMQAMYHLATSEYIYYTHGSPIMLEYKKRNQLLINLWHGCGYKDREKNIERKYHFDYALVPGPIFKKTKSAFWNCSEKKILDIGYPRYDLFFSKKNNNTIIKIKKGRKLIVWMPTFRKTNEGLYPEEKLKTNYELPLLKSDDDLKKLNKLCQNNSILLCIKRHPLQTEYKCQNLKYSNIMFIDNDFLEKKQIDLYSLLKYTEGLITDYSSVAIDYLLLNKPIAFTLDDFEEYSKTRGFVFKNPKKYMPGHHIYNFEDMKKYIEDIGNDKDLYKKDRQAIMNEVHNPCDNYCERIVNKIEDIMEEN